MAECNVTARATHPCVHPITPVNLSHRELAKGQFMGVIRRGVERTQQFWERRTGPQRAGLAWASGGVALTSAFGEHTDALDFARDVAVGAAGFGAVGYVTTALITGGLGLLAKAGQRRRPDAGADEFGFVTDPENPNRAIAPNGTVFETPTHITGPGLSLGELMGGRRRESALSPEFQRLVDELRDGNGGRRPPPDEDWFRTGPNG